jgi:lysozyme family protein
MTNTNRGFLDAVEVVLKNEGGFVNHPADRGGATNWGITKKVYEAYKGRPVSIEEIKNMPKSEAIEIYKRNYWDAIGGDKIKYFSTALTLFDQAVNRGVAAVARQVQSILGLNQDGRFNAQTIAAINAIPDTKFIPQFLTAAENSYKTIVQKNPSQSVFINGWLRRVEKLRSEATRFFGQLNNVQKVGLGLGLIAIIGITAYLVYQSIQKRKNKI